MIGQRKCPLCFVNVPWTEALTHSYEIQCPACHAALELSRYTRMVAGFGGILGAMLAMHLAAGLAPGALWVTRIVAAILGFGVASAAGVLLAGDLVVRAKSSSAAFPHATK